MKNESSVKQILIPAVSLFLICLVCAGLLGFTDKITKEKIAQNAALAEAQARTDAVPAAADFSEPLTTQLDGVDYIYYEAKDSGGTVTAFVFTATSKGYGGDVTVMVGIDTNGLITGVKPVVLNETPGLGMKASSVDWLKQYIGKGESVQVNKTKPADGANEIQAITGATITSKAVTSAVNIAFEAYNSIKEGTANG